MKRYVFLAVAVLIAAASCTKTYEVGTQSEGLPIALGTWNDVLTRAEGDPLGRTVGGTAFANGDKFYVLGSKTVTSSSTTTNVFDGDAVSTTDGSTWTYEPIRFWDANTDKYTFFGVSPSEDISFANLLSAHDVQAGTMTSAEFTFAGNNRDFLIADKKEVAKAAYGSQVVLNFRHAGALFDLKVRKGDGLQAAGATVKLTKVQLNNIQNVGKFSVTGYNASSPYNPTIAWADAATPSTGSYTSANGVTPVTIDNSNKFEVTVDRTSDPQTIINHLMVIPQNFASGGNAPGEQSSKQQLELEYEITTGTGGAAQTVTYHKYYDLILFDIVDYPTDSDSDGDYNDDTAVTGWAAGYYYTYIITIDANAIVFGATVQAWGTDNGYYYILN